MNLNLLNTSVNNNEFCHVSGKESTSCTKPEERYNRSTIIFLAKAARIESRWPNCRPSRSLQVMPQASTAYLGCLHELRILCHIK
jgi:hypothetical protein